VNEPRLVLELYGEDARTQELPLTGTLVLGSSQDRAGFRIEGAGVDETHCAIGRTASGEWAVKDLGSKHGTLLNGQRVSAAKLKLGDQLVLGTRRLELKSARAEAQKQNVQAVGAARPADVPEKLAGYRIERLIGKGAMGSVYLAVQESLRRPVALKVLAPKLAADRDFVQRFQAEARAAAALSHANVVTVYDVGEENGAHYLSMEFMAGGSLEQKLASSGPLPWKSALGVLIDAASGLSYAESRGIVHRDIKPANLMYAGTGTVKIADLGLATTLEQEAIEVGAAGGRKVYGTPHFIAPEQARGEAVDHRSDLYALGATLYRLLCGHTPFEGASTREILRALQSEEPQPLGERVPDLPGDLAAIVMRLLAKDPAERFPTAEALKRECERLRLVSEHGATLEVAAKGKLQGRLAAVLLLLVAGASGWYFLQTGPKPVTPVTPSPSISDRPADDEADPEFFGDENPEPVRAPDEEELLRERERLAQELLNEIPAALTPEERERALEAFLAANPGTGAARTAETELAALRNARATASGPSPEALAAGLEELRAALAAADQEGVSEPLARTLALVASFPAPSGLGSEFELARAALDLELIIAAENGVRAAFQGAESLALEGRFDELRAALAALEPLFAELDTIPGDGARLAGMKGLRDELAARRGRVDEEERFYRANTERSRRLALGAAIGPGSGLVSEVVALDFEALERRLAALAPELGELGATARLRGEFTQARSAVAALAQAFAAGEFRRKSVADPRTKKLRELREVRDTGLVFEKDGALEVVPWKEARADAEWFRQLFDARLARDWSTDEARGVAALLRCIAAARAAELAREMLDGGGRGFLQPAELAAFEAGFRECATWCADAKLADEASASAREAAAGAALSAALAAAQEHAWTRAVFQLETLLAESEGTTLVALLSSGADWRRAAR
jgi:serine/threonine-protein kinase